MSFAKLKREIESRLEDLEQEYENVLDESSELTDMIKELEAENELLKERLSALGEAINE